MLFSDCDIYAATFPVFQNQWVPISLHSSIATSVIVPDDQSLNTSQSSPPNMSTTPKELISGPTFRFKNIFTTPVSLRHSPLPSLCWADSQEVWTVMLQKEERYTRDHAMLDRHATLQARMRSILLDWLIEVGSTFTPTVQYSSFVALSFSCLISQCCVKIVSQIRSIGYERTVTAARS